MRLRRAIVIGGLAVAAAGVTLFAGAAGAHGVGSRGDLPLPVWQVVWGAAIAVVVSFAALGLLWVTPRLVDASTGVSLGARATRTIDWLELATRVFVLGASAVIVTAAWFGTDNAAVNISPIAVFVIFWVGLQVASAVVGGFWTRVNPFDTIAAAVRRERFEQPSAVPAGRAAPLAVISIGAFLWLELAYHSPADPRVLALWLSIHSAVMIGGGVRYGRDWLRLNDGFVVLASLLGAMAPLYRRPDGRVGLRLPFTGLSRLEPDRWTVGFVLVVLGSTTFDGIEGVDVWAEIIAGRSGWELTVVNTIGMAWVVAAVAAVYHTASWFTARLTQRAQPDVAEDFVASLVPIMFAYAIAHYFSLFVFEGQNFIIQASDPYGEGWNLFGTQDNTVDFLLVSTALIAWVQVVSIVVGHIAGVTVAHDRAVERHDAALAIRSQYPMLAAMVAYTVVGLLLLLNA